jgi:UBX domain
LYDLVESLEEKIFEETEEFDIIQTFPYKVFSDREKTLEEEKLFPNALLQIREKDL